MYSRATECALQATVYLALHSDESQPVLSEEISTQLELPRPFMQKCLRDLVEAGILRSRKGRSGGFVLTGPPSDITVFDVVSAIQAVKKYDRCFLGQPECPGEVACPLHEFWGDFQRTLEKRLRDTSLAMMADSLSDTTRFQRPVPTEEA